MKNQGLSVAMTSVLLCQIVSGSILAEDPAPKSILPMPVEEVLWWLPEDTQSVIVAQGPFQVVDPGQNGDIDPVVLECGLRQIACSFPERHLDPDAVKRLRSKVVSLAVGGSRRFRGAVDVLTMLYEGAHIVVFRDDLEADWKSLVEVMTNGGGKAETISGLKAVVFEETLARKPWFTIVAHPKPNTLIFANDRAYLKTLLERMAKRPPTRALPATLPEWKQLDYSAKTWAIRHYDTKVFQDDASSPFGGIVKGANEPDDRAVGLAFWFAPGDRDFIRIKYLSSNQGAAAIARRYWSCQNEKCMPTVRQDRPGVVDISLSRDVPEIEMRIMVMFFLLVTSLGRGAYM